MSLFLSIVIIVSFLGKIVMFISNYEINISQSIGMVKKISLFFEYFLKQKRQVTPLRYPP